MSFTEVDFSLFVLECPLQNKKRKLSSTIRFGSQIEKQEVGVHYLFELPLPIRIAEVLFLLFVLELRAQNESGTIGVELMFWNRDR